MNAVPEITESVRPIVEMRMAKPADVPQLVALYRQFFLQTHYATHLTYSDEGATRHLSYVISTGCCPHILAVLGSDVIGWLAYHIDRSFCAEPLAILDEMYVIPEFAGTPLARGLVSAAMDICRNVEGANCFHIMITSGHKRARTLVNLFKKFGAEEIGVVLRKVF